MHILELLSFSCLPCIYFIASICHDPALISRLIYSSYVWSSGGIIIFHHSELFVWGKGGVYCFIPPLRLVYPSLLINSGILHARIDPLVIPWSTGVSMTRYFDYFGKVIRFADCYKSNCCTMTISIMPWYDNDDYETKGHHLLFELRYITTLFKSLVYFSGMSWIRRGSATSQH